MGIIESLGNAFKAVAAIFGWGQQRDGEKNTAAQQSNAEAATVNADKAKADADLAAPTLDALRRDASE